MAVAIDAMRWAFIQLSEGKAFVHQRTFLNIPDKNATFLVISVCPMANLVMEKYNHH